MDEHRGFPVETIYYFVDLIIVMSNKLLDNPDF